MHAGVGCMICAARRGTHWGQIEAPALPAWHGSLLEMQVQEAGPLWGLLML